MCTALETYKPLNFEVPIGELISEILFKKMFGSGLIKTFLVSHFFETSLKRLITIDIVFYYLNDKIN